MATERIDIVVTERGARTVRRNIEDIGSGAQRAQGAVSLLHRALLALGGAAAVSQLVNLIDTFTNLQNRMRLVTNGTAQLNVVTAELFDIANRTRVSFEGTAEIFNRVALAAKDLGVSQQEVLNFTESLNQAIILSGASAAEAQAGMIQLAQGMASGTLRGDELRSVLEQLPAVADVIAKSLGVTRGELRQMGADGLITADTILKAFREARGELGEQFAKTVPTIGQAFTVLRNNVIELLGSFDRATGIAGLLARGILAIANNVDVLARAFAAAAIVVGTVFAARAVGAAITAVQALTAAMLANPIGAIAVALTTVASLLITFSDRIMLSTDSLANLQDLGAAVFEELSAAVSSLVSFFSEGFALISSYAGDFFSDMDLSVAGLLLGAAWVIDRYIGLYVGAFRAIVAVWDNLPDAFRDIFSRALNGAISLVETGINKIISAINAVTEFTGLGSIGAVSLGRVESSAAGGAARLGEAVKDGFLEGFNQTAVTDTVNRVISRAEQLAKERLANEQLAASEEALARQQLGQAGERKVIATMDEDSIKKSKKQRDILKELIADLELEYQLLQLTSREREVRGVILQTEAQLGRELTAVEEANLEALLQRNQLLREEEQLLQDINGPAEDYANNIATLERLLARGAISQEQFNRAMRDARIAMLDQNTDVASGLERGFLRAQSQMEDFASSSERLITDAFANAQDAVVSFFETGKFQADDFFRSLANNFLRLGTQQLFAAAFGSGGPLGGLGSILGGGGGGGIGGFVSSLLGFNNGGSFTVGPDTSVATIPGVDNRLIAFRARDGENVTINRPGESGARPVQVNFNITTPDADSFRRSQGQILARTSAALQRANSRNN